MSSEEIDDQKEIIDELGSSFLEAQDGGDGTLDVTAETNPSQNVSQTDDDEILGKEEQEGGENGLTKEEAEEEGDMDELALDAEGEVAEADGSLEEEKESSATEKEPANNSQKAASKKKEEQEEEEDVEENEEAQKKMAEKFDPNQMPQVNVATLATRKWQIKVYPLRPSDFMSGHISKVFKQAKESLLYLYTAGNNGKFSNGKAELYVSTISQATKVMHNLLKMEFFHPETNIKIIRRDDSGAVVEKANMRFDTKMTSLLCQPSGPQRRIGTKRERIIGSVFLKNLPDVATKDMLRVMFPFAAEINFNPEKFKDCTARLVLTNRNGVIPCLKAFSKVELGGHILELRPLEKRKKPDDVPKKSADTEKTDKSKDEDKASTPAAKDTKTPGKDGDVKPSTEKEKEGEKKGATTGTPKAGPKDNRKPGLLSKKPDAKRGRGGLKPLLNSSRFGGVAKKYPQSRFGQQRWQDRQGGLSTNRRGGFYSGGGRGSSFSSNRNQFDSYGGSGFRSGTSPGRMQMAGGMGGGHSDMVNAEVTKEMIQLQAQLNTAIKNQMSMLSQTQLALEQAKRGAAVSTAAAAAAMGANTGGGSSASSLGFSRAGNATQDQYRVSEQQTRRNQLDNTNRQRGDNRNNRARDNRRDSFGTRGSARGNRDTRASNFGKRNVARAGFASDTYDNASYAKRSNFGTGRSWAEETEDLDVYRNNSSLGGYGSTSYTDDAGDYADDSAYASLYSARSATSRVYGGTNFGASARDLDYSGSNYDYGY